MHRRVWQATVHGVVESSMTSSEVLPPGRLTPAKSPFGFFKWNTQCLYATHTLLLLPHLTAGETRPCFPIHRPTPVVCRAPDKSAREAGLGRHAGEASEATCFRKRRSGTVPCRAVLELEAKGKSIILILNLLAFLIVCSGWSAGINFHFLAYCIPYWFVLVAEFLAPLESCTCSSISSPALCWFLCCPGPGVCVDWGGGLCRAHDGVTSFQTYLQVLFCFFINPTAYLELLLKGNCMLSSFLHQPYLCQCYHGSFSRMLVICFRINHCCVRAWKIPWTEEPGRLQSMGSREEWDTAERLHLHFSLLCIGEGSGNPIQCSCLENPRDGVTQSRTRLKWLRKPLL